MERERILERTNEGRIAAMASGVKFERKPHRQSDMVWELITQDAPEKTILEKT
ncbi:Recombinase family protein (fragment) [Enterobacterales bacterium 8AC]